MQRTNEKKTIAGLIKYEEPTAESPQILQREAICGADELRIGNWVLSKEPPA